MSLYDCERGIGGEINAYLVSCCNIYCFSVSAG
jgi:hypothetical protein